MNWHWRSWQENDSMLGHDLWSLHIAALHLSPSLYVIAIWQWSWYYNNEKNWDSWNGINPKIFRNKIFKYSTQHRPFDKNNFRVNKVKPYHLAMRVKPLMKQMLTFPKFYKYIYILF